MVRRCAIAVQKKSLRENGGLPESLR